MKRNLALALAVAASAFALWAEPDSKPTLLISKTKQGLALEGYDPVAYFTDHHAEKGDPKFTSSHDGATYRFTRADRKALFDAAPVPTQYSPA